MPETHQFTFFWCHQHISGKRFFGNFADVRIKESTVFKFVTFNVNATPWKYFAKQRSISKVRIRNLLSLRLTEKKSFYTDCKRFYFSGPQSDEKSPAGSQSLDRIHDDATSLQA